MKTILTALREENKVTDESARTIARALGGTTIASAVSPVEEDTDDSNTDNSNANNSNAENGGADNGGADNGGADDGEGK